MPFEILRQHQKKVLVPLAIVVTITMVFFGAAGGLRNLFRGGADTSLQRRLEILGYDLTRAQMLSPAPSKRYRQRAEEAFKGQPDAEKKINDYVSDMVRDYYISMAAKHYYIPVEEARKMGIRISDKELNDRVIQIVEKGWGVEPFNQKDYHETLKNFNMTVGRFEELVRGKMMRECLDKVLLESTGASSSEQLASYMRDEQKVQVQYFQRTPEEFIDKVQVLPGKRPEKKSGDKNGETAEVKIPADKPEAGAEGNKAPAAKAGPEDKKAPETASGKKEEGKATPAAAGGKAGDETGPEESGEKAAEEEKKKPGILYEEEISERYKQLVEYLDKRYNRSSSDGEWEWPATAPEVFPDLFTEARARLDYLLALPADFKRKAKVSEEDVKTYYENNKKSMYTVKDEGKKADPKAAPSFKPLDSKLKAEIREKLVERQARDLASKAIEAAISEYNDEKNRDEKGQRPDLRAIARKHSLKLGSAGPANREKLEKAEALDSWSARINRVFILKDRKELGDKLVDKCPLKDEKGFVTYCVAEYQPVKLLALDAAREGFTYRQKYLEAWEMAKTAIDKDREELVEGKLKPDRVRLSALLGPGHEVCEQVASDNLAVGEASQPFVYSEPLGPEKEADDKRKEAEARLKKEKKPLPEKSLEEKIRESLSSGSRDQEIRKGWRVVVLARREEPDPEEFSKARSWKSKWNASRMPDYMIRMSQMYGQPASQPPGVQWQDDFLEAYYQSKFEVLLTRLRAGNN